MRIATPGLLAALAAVVLVAGSLGGCARQALTVRAASDLAMTAGMRPWRIASGGFTILAFRRAGMPSASSSKAYSKGSSAALPRPLRIYLEGDGRAWASRTRPASDPTPAVARGLELAVADDYSGPLLYLARPCQFTGVDAAPCKPSLWLDARYSRAIVDGLADAVRQGLRWAGTRRVELFGFSGGGTLALLLATRLSGVDRVVTFGAPLAVAEWTRLHGLSPLAGSMDPIDHAAILRRVRQVHLRGRNDAIVPVGVHDTYRARVGPAPELCFIEIEGLGHDDCCERHRWRTILRLIDQVIRERACPRSLHG